MPLIKILQVILITFSITQTDAFLKNLNHNSMIKILPLFLIVLLSACQVFPKQENRVVINEKEKIIEIVELYSPRIKYQILTITKNSPLSDSIHHTFRVQYSLNFEIEYNSLLQEGDDSISVHLSGFQIVKNNKGDYWNEGRDYQCYDTIKVVPIFKKNIHIGLESASLRKESGEIKFGHFGSCRQANVTIQMGDRIINTLQIWHKS